MQILENEKPKNENGKTIVTMASKKY